MWLSGLQASGRNGIPLPPVGRVSREPRGHVCIFDKRVKYVSETVYFYNVVGIKEQVQTFEIIYPSGS